MNSMYSLFSYIVVYAFQLIFLITQHHKVRNENWRFLVAWLMAQKRRCRASVSTSLNKDNFCSADNGAFTLILFSIQGILELKTVILSRNLSAVAKKQDPFIFYAWSRFWCWY